MCSERIVLRSKLKNAFPPFSAAHRNWSMTMGDGSHLALTLAIPWGNSCSSISKVQLTLFPSLLPLFLTNLYNWLIQNRGIFLSKSNFCSFFFILFSCTQVERRREGSESIFSYNIWQFLARTSEIF